MLSIRIFLEVETSLEETVAPVPKIVRMVALEEETEKTPETEMETALVREITLKAVILLRFLIIIEIKTMMVFAIYVIASGLMVLMESLISIEI